MSTKAKIYLAMISCSSEKLLTANATIALQLTIILVQLVFNWCFYAGTLSFACSNDGIIE